MSRPRRSSARISLVLIGVAGLAACGRDSRIEYRRDAYASLADCKADWTREEQCEPATGPLPGTAAPASSGGSGYYLGPRYSWYPEWDRTGGGGGSSASGTGGGFRAGAGSHAFASIPVERGGFGSLGGFHARGG